ncbi:hypothetical protein B0H21DRAFT_893189 [Amylocystis lapponica]|nr:hypothetical protein B0H21DRAFT_893189 [Amylocystis lapponica]
MAVPRLSSPERRRGHKRLPPIPVEIYMIIFDELRYDPEDIAIADTKSILANLALVCRLFSSLIVPKLFSKFVFEGRQTGAYPHTPSDKERACALWLQHISNGDEAACTLANLVKELTFHNWKAEGRALLSPAPPGLPLSRYVRIVPRFENLWRLELLSVPITRHFFEAVGTLQKLRTLCIRECEFGAVDAAVVIPDIPAPCLTEFELREADDVLPYVPALARLAAKRSLRSLQTTVWEVARGVMELRTDIPLEQLEVPLVPNDAAILARFLDRTPSLLDLSIMDPSDSGDAGRPCFRLQKSSLPNLTRLRCPPYLLPTLVQDRSLPLEQLNLIEINDWIYPRVNADIALLGPLKDCSLRRLHVPVFLFRDHPLDEHLYRVEELTICFPIVDYTKKCEENVTSICSAKSRKLGVRRLELRFYTGTPVHWMFDLKLQHREVTRRLAVAFPTATQFVLSDVLEWHRDAGGGKTWRPVVPAREYFRSAVLHTVGTGLTKMTDFNGALAALFRDDREMSVLVRRLCGESGRPTRR